MIMALASIAGLFLLSACLIGLLLLIAAPIVLALFLVGMVLRLLFFLLVLPFRLLGALFGLGFWSLGWLVRGGILLVGLGVLILLGALPLVPLLLVAAGVYLVFRAMRPRSAPLGHA
jgi:hypothetical protein